MDQTNEIFVSYKAEDRPRVQLLVDALHGAGFTVWWDAHIGGGAGWRKDIEEHLAAAKCVVVVWSKRSIGEAGDFVKDEASRAKRAGTYLPVKIDKVEPPLGFGEVQALNLVGWKGDPKAPQFQAVIEAARARLDGKPIPQGVGGDAGPTVSRRAVMAGGAVAAVAVAGGAGYWLIGGGSAEAKRIAVMPFANLSGDESQAYMSSGLSEELRASLSRVGLEVIGRASSEAVKDDNIKEAASELGVANLLTGSVRTSPNLIRISAQLVSGKDGVEKWSQTYDRKPGDIIQIQTDIATNVAQALTLALASTLQTAIAMGGTKDPVAQQLLQQAILLIRTKGGAAFNEALPMYDAALSRDPNYVDAMVQQATTMATAAMNMTNADEIAAQLREALTIARRAVTLAPEYGRVHLALGNVHKTMLDLPAATSEYRRALELAPNDSWVMRVAASALGAWTEPTAYLPQLERAVSLDPLNPQSYYVLAFALFHTRRYAPSIIAFRKILEIKPERVDVYPLIAINYAMLNNFNDANVALKNADPEDFNTEFVAALIAARMKNSTATYKLLDKMQAEYGDPYASQYAMIYAQLGETDLAFAALDKAMKAKDPGLEAIKNDPTLDPIRNDPRFPALIKRLGFPDA